MTLNKQNIPELEEGNLFTAVLPSREKLLKMFREERGDLCIKEFIEGLRNEGVPLYFMNTCERNRETYGTSWIRWRILEGNTLLLCQQVTREGTAPFGRSTILGVLHSDVTKSKENVTDYFGFDHPFIYNGLLTNITRVSSGIIV